MTAHLTQDALYAAWENMRRRDAMRNWPPSFEQVMADPLRSRMVRLEATHRAVKPATSCRPARPLAPALRPALAPRFDHKRAASGERDDD